MTTNTFKLKAPTVQAIEVTDLIKQTPDVANLIGSQAYQVKIASQQQGVSEATFIRTNSADITVKEGQVVSVETGTPTVWDSKDFYALYETV